MIYRALLLSTVLCASLAVSACSSGALDKPVVMSVEDSMASAGESEIDLQPMDQGLSDTSPMAAYLSDPMVGGVAGDKDSAYDDGSVEVFLPWADDAKRHVVGQDIEMRQRGYEPDYMQGMDPGQERDFIPAEEFADYEGSVSLGASSSGSSLQPMPHEGAHKAQPDPEPVFLTRDSYEPNHEKAAKVYFDHGAGAPDEGGVEVISRVAQAISKDKHPIKVSGFASARAGVKDPVERQIANLKTSLNRAFEVSKRLIRSGVPAEAIETSAWGESHPAPATGDLSSESASRRVEIYSRLPQ